MLRLALLSLSFTIITVIASCVPTSETEELLDEMHTGKPTAPVYEMENNMEKYKHLTTDSTVSDVVDNPAFKGFGHYILPLEWRYDPNMKLRDIPSLLPYHNYVDSNRSTPNFICFLIYVMVSVSALEQVLTDGLTEL